MMSSEETVWFKSEVDWPIGLLLVSVPIVELTALLSAVLSGSRESITANLVGVAFVALIYCFLLYPISYGISGEALHVRFGAVRRRILFSEIVEVHPSHNLISSPALSIDRLAIRTGRGPLQFTLISPVSREEFLELLETRSGLIRSGERLARAEGFPKSD